MMYNVYVSEHPCYPLSIKTIKTITITTGSTPTVQCQKLYQNANCVELAQLGFILEYEQMIARVTAIHVIAISVLFLLISTTSSQDCILISLLIGVTRMPSQLYNFQCLEV